MAPPTDKQLQWAKEQVLQHGPLPRFWRMQPHPLDAERGVYRGWSGERIFENHPNSIYFDDEASSEFIEEEFVDGSFAAPEQQLGVLHPPQYGEGVWTWQSAASPVEAVIQAVMACELYGYGNARPQESYLKHIYTTQVLSPEPDAYPQVMYHPADANKTPHPQEPETAAFTRRLGFALVVVSFDHGHWANCFAPRTSIANTTTRWSLGANYELYPPLYLGYGAGTWWWLRAKSQATYSLWSPPANSWASLIDDIRKNGVSFPFNEDAMIQVGVRIQRMIRMGMPLPDPSTMDQLVSKLAYRLAASQEDASFLEQWNEKARDIKHPAVSFSRLTKLIACSGSKRARALAIAYDRALRVRASSTDTPASDHRDYLVALSPDLSRARQQANGSSLPAQQAAASKTTTEAAPAKSSAEAPPSAPIDKSPPAVAPGKALSAVSANDPVPFTSMVSNHIDSLFRRAEEHAELKEMEETTKIDEAGEDGFGPQAYGPAALAAWAQWEEEVKQQRAEDQRRCIAAEQAKKLGMVSKVSMLLEKYNRK
ncbi:Hypothetical predicted protein [Lecanosticta acicola]|uniref:Uncharacterized protein n=1 Tax=Lecanosticta acicola TaxID=111012 RepID=A0AAI8YX99_9PEZI|nr:Hypothetical predicted protein [Lecanosticta acicola]